MKKLLLMLATLATLDLTCRVRDAKEITGNAMSIWDETGFVSHSPTGREGGAEG